MSVSAIEKAGSLYEYVKAQGAQPSTFAVTLTLAEGLELLDWFIGQYPPNALLDEDVAQAKCTQNPWGVLSHFTLMGLSILPQGSLH